MMRDMMQTGARVNRGVGEVALLGEECNLSNRRNSRHNADLELAAELYDYATSLGPLFAWHMARQRSYTAKRAQYCSDLGSACTCRAV